MPYEVIKRVHVCDKPDPDADPDLLLVGTIIQCLDIDCRQYWLRQYSGHWVKCDEGGAPNVVRPA